MLTKYEQRFLLETLLKGKIKRNDQKIYKTKNGFFFCTKKLKGLNLIDSKLCKNSSEKIYFLTFKGFVRANFIALDENNGSRYNQVANPDIITVLEGYRKWIG